jgi:hypothetical protein
MPSSLGAGKSRESVVFLACRVLTLLPSRVGDPLVHYGRHFGRAVHAMCSIQALLTNGILRMGEEGEVVEESLTLERVLFIINPLFC